MAEPTDAMKALASKLNDDLMTEGYNAVVGDRRADFLPIVALALLQAEAEGAKEERAAVVRWLRFKSWAQSEADEIEGGDHLPGAP